MMHHVMHYAVHLEDQQLATCALLNLGAAEPTHGQRGRAVRGRDRRGRVPPHAALPARIVPPRRTAHVDAAPQASGLEASREAARGRPGAVVQLLAEGLARAVRRAGLAQVSSDARVVEELADLLLCGTAALRLPAGVWVRSQSAGVRRLARSEGAHRSEEGIHARSEGWCWGGGGSQERSRSTVPGISRTWLAQTRRDNAKLSGGYKHSRPGRQHKVMFTHRSRRPATTLYHTLKLHREPEPRPLQLGFELLWLIVCLQLRGVEAMEAIGARGARGAGGARASRRCPWLRSRLCSRLCSRPCAKVAARRVCWCWCFVPPAGECGGSAGSAGRVSQRVELFRIDASPCGGSVANREGRVLLILLLLERLQLLVHQCPRLASCFKFGPRRKRPLCVRR